MAEQHRERGEHATAQMLLGEAIETDPENPDLRAELALVRYFAGDYFGAIKEAEHVLDEDPANDKAAKALSGAVRLGTWDKQRRERAAIALAAALAKSPTSALLLAERAAVEFHEARYEEALQTAKRVLQSEHANQTAYDIIDLVLQRLGRRDEAETFFRGRIVSRDDDHNALWFLARLSRSKRGGLSEALAFATRAAGIVPAHEKVRLLVVDVLCLMGHLDEAEREAENAAAEIETSVWLRLQLSRLRASTGDFDGAELWLRRAETVRPNSSECMTRRVELLAQQGRWDEAHSAAQTALESAPGDIGVRATAAMLHYETWQLDDSRRLIGETTDEDETLTTLRVILLRVQGHTRRLSDWARGPWLHTPEARNY